MAGVVTHVCLSSISRTVGMIDYTLMQDSMRLKYFVLFWFVLHVPNFNNRFANVEVHFMLTSMLEFFEIVYRMKGRHRRFLENVNIIHEQMFYVPSLLSPYVIGEEHPAWNFWQLSEFRYILI